MSNREDRELNEVELQAFAAELDALRQRTLASLGSEDARYIRRVRAAVRACASACRWVMWRSICE